MADINDLIKQYYSINDLRDSAKPIDTSKYRRDLLKTKLQDHFRRLQEAKKVDQMKVFNELEDMKDDLAWLWKHDEGLVTEHLFKMRGLRGFARATDKILRDIKGEVLAQQQDELSDPEVGPDDSVLDLLRRKPIREGGVIVGYDAPLNLALNARIIFENDTRWRNRIEYCELSGIATIDREFVIDSECYSAKLWLEEHYQNMCLPKNEVGLVVDNVGRNNAFHPIREMLDGLPSWDMQPRLDSLFSKYFNSVDSELHRAYSAKTLISAVARAYEPGCKVDTMTVLIGTQGAMKSEALKILTLDKKYFTDTTIDIRSKDSFINIQGKWIVEIAECEGIFRGGYNLSKSWLTSQTDRYRAPYAQYATDHPRQCIFIATTNERDLQFLADPTGNRRFWSLSVGEIDFNALKRDVKQIWAEALYRYRTQETWWLSKKLEQSRKEQNDRFALGDSWEDSMFLFFQHARREKFTSDADGKLVIKFTLDDVYNFFDIDHRSQDMKSSKRIAALLRKNNAFKKRIYSKGDGFKKTVWFWYPPREDEE
jgi:hypothetical protein